MTYDSNGNILTATGQTYTYNAANRMATSNDGTTTTSYLINFMGQRTNKSNTTSTTWFIYDENDNVIAEYDANGNLTDEYVYLDNRPLALIRASNLYYIYTDYLNTPRAITDTSNNLQWTWENSEAFGNNAPVEVVSGFKFNMRFPGQYFDSETNLNYNIHRDYNPVWGRYVTSDPLGLAAGINTYGYVGGNSLGSSDRLGLEPGYINFGLTKNQTGFNYIGFKIEEIYKTSFANPNDQLILLSHGSTISLNTNKPADLASQIITGKYKTNSGLVTNNYYTEQILSGKPINLTLDACQTGTDAKEGIYAKNLLDILKNDLTKRGAKNTLSITAPNGNTYFTPFGDIVIKENNKKGNFITFK